MYAINYATFISRLGLKPENSRKESRCASAETLLDLGIEGENILVGKLESGKRSWEGSVHCSRMAVC